MKIKELIDKVNSITNCYSIHHAEDFIEGKTDKVASNLNIDEYR